MEIPNVVDRQLISRCFPCAFVCAIPVLFRVNYLLVSFH